MATYDKIYHELQIVYQELMNSRSQKEEVYRYIEQEKKDIVKALKNLSREILENAKSAENGFPLNGSNKFLQWKRSMNGRNAF